MDDISEFLTGPQRATGSSFGIVLTVIALVLASALLLYFLRCYIQETLIRKRVKRLVHQAHLGNIVPPEVIFSDLSEPGVRGQKSVRPPNPSFENRTVKVRHARRPHPWKQNRLSADSATPH